MDFTQEPAGERDAVEALRALRFRRWTAARVLLDFGGLRKNGCYQKAPGAQLRFGWHGRNPAQ
jgi:hypothetical protein